MKKTIIINNLEQMDLLAKYISNYIVPGFIIGLKGDLGAGKTTFTKYLAKYLGIEDNVNSPTFTILKVYPGKLPLYHMDVYRLEGIGYDYELDDFLYGEGLSVVEWYPYIETMLPKDFLSIEIIVLTETTRKIILEGCGDYEQIIEQINT